MLYKVARRLEVVDVGVAVKVNVDPPSFVEGMMDASLVAEIVKSDISPVVAPDKLLHPIVHVIGTAIRAMLDMAEQLSVEEAVGMAETQYAPRYPVGQL